MARVGIVRTYRKGLVRKVILGCDESAVDKVEKRGVILLA